MRVLYFTKYTRMGASSRMRSFQYFPALKDAGVEIDVSPLFTDEYLKKLYAGDKIGLLLVLKCYLARLVKLFSLRRNQKVVIEKELFPYMPALVEWIISKLGIKYIADYDDAIFHNYDLSKNPAIKFVLKNKIDQVMKYAETVTVGNNYLAKRAKDAGAKHVIYLPTVIDLERYTLALSKLNKPFVIGWIGSASTTKYVENLKSVFVKLAAHYDFELHIVGGNSLKWGHWVKNIAWTEATEVEEIKNMDVGIMPLIDSPWEKGKCAYKLIQYMACGLPVVASPVGANYDVVVENINGYFANDKKQWFTILEKYMNNAKLASIHGAVGRKIVEEKFTLQVMAERLIKVLKE